MSGRIAGWPRAASVQNEIIAMDASLPALNAGMSEQLDGTIACLRDDHAKQEAALNRIAAITHGLRLPGYACDSWRDLYAGLGKLAEDLDEHRYLEDDVLFPRFETCR